MNHCIVGASDRSNRRYFRRFSGPVYYMRRTFQKTRGHPCKFLLVFFTLLVRRVFVDNEYYYFPFARDIIRSGGLLFTRQKIKKIEKKKRRRDVGRYTLLRYSRLATTTVIVGSSSTPNAAHRTYRTDAITTYITTTGPGITRL